MSKTNFFERIKNNENLIPMKSKRFNFQKVIVNILIIVILMILITSQNKLIQIYKPLIIIFFLLPFFVEIKNKKLNIKISKLFIIWAILLVYFSFGIIYSIERHDTLYNLVILSFGFLFLIHKFSLDFYEKLIKAIEYITIFSAITIILSAAFPNEFASAIDWFKIEVETVYDSAANGYATGIIFEKARAAFVMNIGIAIVVSTILVKKEYTKKNIFKLGLLFLALLLTGKRMLTAIAILVTIVLFVLVSKKTKKTYKNLFIVLCVASMATAIFCLIFPKVGLVFQRMMNVESTVGGREIFWDYALEMLKKSPVLGHGLGTFNAYLSDVGFTYYRAAWTSHAHNTYLQILAETGVIGFVLMVIALIYTFWQTAKLLIKKYNKVNNQNDEERKRQLYISLAMQIIYWLYALTGNPFHNFQEIYSYIIFISILNCRYRKIEENHE